MAIDQTQRYQAKDNYILRTVAGNNVLISIGENIANFNGYIKLNETAVFLWKQLQESKTVAELADAMTTEFDVSPEQAEADALEFLETLEKDDMVILHE